MCLALLKHCYAREKKVRWAEGRCLSSPPSKHCTLHSLASHVIDFCLGPAEAFSVVKWRNSLTDCSLCLILQISTNNHLNGSADLFLMRAIHYLTFGSHSRCEAAGRWLILGLHWDCIIHQDYSVRCFPPCITKKTFFIYYQNWMFSIFRPEKLLSILCALIFIHL